MPAKQIPESRCPQPPAETAPLLWKAWDSLAELGAPLGCMCVGTEEGSRALFPPFPSHQVTS